MMRVEFKATLKEKAAAQVSESTLCSIQRSTLVEAAQDTLCNSVGQGVPQLQNLNVRHTAKNGGRSTHISFIEDFLCADRCINRRQCLSCKPRMDCEVIYKPQDTARSANVTALTRPKGLSDLLLSVYDRTDLAL